MKDLAQKLMKLIKIKNGRIIRNRRHSKKDKKIKNVAVVVKTIASTNPQVKSSKKSLRKIAASKTRRND